MSTEAEDLGERIAEMAAHLDAATHGLLTALRDYDRSTNWYAQGFPSCAKWLSWRVGMSTGTARDHLRVAHRLADLPLIDDALRTGAISYSKVRAMTRVATPANEATLLEDARYSTGAQLETICRKYATVVRAAKEVDPDYDRERRRITRRDLDDGMVRLEATLHPDEAALVWAALDQIARERCKAAIVVAAQNSTSDEPPLAAEAPRGEFNRADALVAMSQGVVRGNAPQRSPIELVVTVAADVLHREVDSAEPSSAPNAAFADGTCVAAEPSVAPNAAFADGTCVAAEPSVAPIAAFADGTCVSAETARRLACACSVVRMTENANGTVLSVGRKTRSIPAPIKRALLRRDACCQFPGCSNHLYVEGHHIEHWASGGETALHNLLGLCSFHHRFVHEYGYRVELDERQRAHFFDPRGRETLDVPERVEAPNLGWSAIREANTHLGITTTTGACDWDGETVDYGAVIDDLVRVDGLQ